MALQHLICPKCSAEKLEARTINGQSGYYCPYCGTEFTEQVGLREYEKLEATIRSGLGSVIDEALLNERTNKYFNLRSMLWGKITANYTDSAAIIAICRDILAIAQHDFLAEFFELANSSTHAEVADYILKIDEKENAFFIEIILDFIIKSLEEEYITPTAALIERCGKIFSPEKKQEYLTRFEEEVKKVAAGIYETSLERDVFLAYSSKDMPRVIEALNLIEANGLSCFAAFRNLKHGRDAVMNYERALEDAIDHCSIFVFVSSANSRSFSCDAFKKEMAYIRNTEMAKHPECRVYGQLPEKYRKLRIEYRIDNTPTPLVEKTVKDFFAGQTYAENHDQLIAQLGECMERLTTVYSDEPETPAQPSHAPIPAPTPHENEAESKRKAAEDAKKAKEEEANRRALEKANRKNDVNAGFKIKNGVLKKYTGKDLSVAIPDSVTSIDDNAFNFASSIINVTIPNSVTNIGEHAFYNCTSLNSITIPSSVTSIGRCAFSLCKNLASVTFEENSRITSLNDFTFSNCTSLRSVNIPSGVTAICHHAFASCTSLDSINIPEGVIKIGDGAFDSCKSLKSVTIPDGVTSIGLSAFYSCENLVSVTFGDNAKLNNIGWSAFKNCNKLKEVVIPDSVTKIGDAAFPSTTTVIKHSDVGARAKAEEMEARRRALEEPERKEKEKAKHENEMHGMINKSIDAMKKCNFSDAVCNEIKRALTYAYTRESKKTQKELEYVCDIVDGVLVKYLNRDASVIFIPNSITRISDFAFSDCAARWITIPSSVTNIAATAFVKCDHLKYIAVEEDNMYYKYIDGILYTKDGKTLIHYPRNKEEEAFTLPDGVTSIGDYAFYGCNSGYSYRNDITIPEGVTTIGNYAFAHSEVHSVTIPSSVTKIGEGAFDDSSTTIYLSPKARTSGYSNNWHGGKEVINNKTGKPISDSGIFKKLFK